MTSQISKSDAEWRAQLTDEQYRITRKHGTERAGTGPHQHVEGDGQFTCVCCDALLFEAKSKFESGTGWPSFYEPAPEGQIGEKADRSFFMKRTEVHCSQCEAHLGHVFPDGPPPTGLRYCINGHALKFLASTQE